MAQGFKRTGNAFSLKKSSSSSSGSRNSNKIRKGARIIAAKKDVARAKSNLTHKLTAQLNRRAESALITRMGGNREGSLKLVRPDAQIVEEIKAKKARREIGRNSNEKEVVEEKTGGGGGDAVVGDSTSMNSLTKSALNHLNNEFETLEEQEEEEDDDDDDNDSNESDEEESK